MQSDRNQLTRKLAFCAAALTVVFPSVSEAQAQDYPNRRIRIVMGFPAGGPTDVPVRLLADKMSKAMDVPVVVENKPGAASRLAIHEVLSLPRDGYNLLACSYLDPVNTLLYRTTKYQTSDIQGVTLIARYAYTALVPKDLPVKSFPELVALSKAKPGTLNYGHLGAGSLPNLMVKKLEKLTGLDMAAVTFKGTAESAQEVVAGRVHFNLSPPITGLPLHEGNLLKIVAVTADERMPSLPTVPTFKELGVPVVAYAWIGICVGAGTPKAIVDTLNKQLSTSISSEDYRTLVQKSGSVPVSTTPAETDTVIRQTVAEFEPIIKEAAIQLD